MALASAFHPLQTKSLQTDDHAISHQMPDSPSLNSADKSPEENRAATDWALMTWWRRALFYPAVALLIAGGYRIIFVSNPDVLGQSLIVLSMLVLLLSTVGLKNGGYRDSEY